jgi:hypothetical protein
MDNPMTRKELLARVRKETGVGKHAELVLDHIEQRDDPTLVTNALSGDPNDFSDLLAAVKREAALVADVEANWIAGASQGGWQSAGPDSSSLLSAPEQMRAKVTALALAEVASEIPRVHRFRRDVLNGSLLDEKSAIAFLRSPALAFFSSKEMKEAGAPIVGHNAVVIEGTERSRVRHDATIFSIQIDPPGVVLSKAADVSGEPVTFRIPVEGTQIERRFIYRGSVLYGLRGLTDFLAPWYWWSWDEAIQWVLMGRVPATPAIRSQFLINPAENAERAIITLAIDPWVSPESVERVYRAMRKKYVSGGFRDWNRGRPLAVFLFVAEERLRSGTTLSWRDLLDRWESANPDRSYDGGLRNFRRDYQRAKDYLLRPYKNKLTRPYPRKLPQPYMW